MTNRNKNASTSETQVPPYRFAGFLPSPYSTIVENLAVTKRLVAKMNELETKAAALQAEIEEIADTMETLKNVRRMHQELPACGFGKFCVSDQDASSTLQSLKNLGWEAKSLYDGRTNFIQVSGLRSETK